MPNLKAKIDTDDLISWVEYLELAIKLLRDPDVPETRVVTIIENVKNAIEKEHFNAF